MSEDTISRQAAIDAMTNYFARWAEYTAWSKTVKSMVETAQEAAREMLTELPSTHPELGEWCHDCKEYDKEHHCCPRWNRVIKTALEDAKPEQRWIPVSERLPEDYEDVLVWFEYFRYGDYNRLYQTHGIGDYSSKYDSWMINHESGWSKLRVFAWMPLPEPYKMEVEHETD